MSNKERDDSKLEAREIDLKSSNRLLRSLDNFWFYHKWKVIIIAFFAIVLIVGIVQMVSKTESDAGIIVAVPDILYAEEISDIENTLVSLMPSDRNGDGKKQLNLSTYKIYSEDEMIAANEAETDPDGNPVIYADRGYNTSQYEQYTDYLMTGECSVMIVSEYLYSKLRENDRVLPLSEVFGSTVPTGALSDGYGVSLSELEIYKYEGLSTLPEGTVVCILRQYFIGASSDDEVYDYSKQFFRSIVEFGN